jgi:hypothetical protein
MKKTIAVNSDDPQRPWVNLTMAGKVKSFAKVAPRSARLKGNVGEALKAEVRITPVAEYPFKITDVVVKNGRHIAYELTEPSAKTEGAYLLTVTNTRKDAGRYTDFITLKTDSKVRDQLKVTVYGYISDPSKKKTAKRKRTVKRPIPTKTDG